jgi:hypothetical protein
MMTVRRFQKWNVINVIYIQNDACYVPKRGNKLLYFKYLLSRQQMVFHLFFALTVSIRSWVLFPTLCGSINTKYMGRTNIKCQNGPVLPPAQVFILMVRLYYTTPLISFFISSGRKWHHSSVWSRLQHITARTDNVALHIIVFQVSNNQFLF